MTNILAPISNPFEDLPDSYQQDPAMHFKTQVKPASTPFQDRFNNSPFAHDGTDLEDLFDSPEQFKVHKEEVVVNISPLGNNLNFLCSGMDMNNEGTTNA